MRNKSPKPNIPTGAGEDVCAGHALGFPLRGDLGLSAIENLTLDVFRAICEIYTSGSAQPWEIGHRIAEEHLGSADGPLLVARITALLRALRSERKLGLSYLSIGCQHVSPDELAIAGLLKAARARDERGIQRGLTLALDKAQNSTRTLAAARELAALQNRLSALDREGSTEAQEFHALAVQALYLH